MIFYIISKKGALMYYKCLFSEAFLIHSIIRFSHTMLEKERLFEVFNLAHSYGRWKIKAQSLLLQGKALPTTSLIISHRKH